MKAVLSFVWSQAVCRILFAALASKTRKEGRWTDNHWILEHSATDGDFWNAACTDIKMDHRRSYMLTVKLDQIDPRTDQMLVPKLEGGGNELP
jgi:hypothetical protein